MTAPNTDAERPDSLDDSSRRLFMKTAAATGAAVSMQSAVTAQNGEDSDGGTGDVVTDGPTVGLERVGGGFTSPVGFEVAPGQDDRYYVVDQVGQIRVLESETGDGEDGVGTDDGGDDGAVGNETDDDASVGNESDDDTTVGNESDDTAGGGNESGDGGMGNESDDGGGVGNESDDGGGMGTDGEDDEGGADGPGPMQLRDEPFLDLTDRMVEVGGEEGEFDERGLLGLAFHPDFRENGRFYVRYSAPPTEDTPEDYDHTAILAEFTTEGDDHETGDPDSEEILLEVPEPQFNHNAGAVLFGPDDYLYVPLGDGGNADDVGLGHVEDWYDENEGGNAQNTTENFLGSILRIDVDAEGDGDRPYGIPDDNPFVDSDAGLDEYYAWGLRNPWRASFDSEGRFFVADVGQNLFEEVSIVENGGNYGWNVKEGIECFSTENPGEPGEDCPNATPDDVRGGEDLLDPVIQYPHVVDEETLGISITGGFVYEGDTVSALDDTYVYGDWSTSFGTPDGSLFASPVQEYEPAADRSEDDLWEIQELSVSDSANDRINRFILAFGRDHDDELYVLTTARYTDGETGEVWRIVPEGEGETIEPHENAVGSEDEDEEESEEEDAEDEDADDGDDDAETGDGEDDDSDDDNESADDSNGDDSADEEDNGSAGNESDDG